MPKRKKMLRKMQRKIQPLKKRNSIRIRPRNQLIEDIRFLLELKDKSADGKWDYQTIRRIDEIGQSVGRQ
jgi:hypothetical protein